MWVINRWRFLSPAQVRRLLRWGSPVLRGWGFEAISPTMNIHRWLIMVDYGWLWSKFHIRLMTFKSIFHIYIYIGIYYNDKYDWLKYLTNDYPLVNVYATMGRSTIPNRWKKTVSLAIVTSKLLVYQRVYLMWYWSMHVSHHNVASMWIGWILL